MYIDQSVVDMMSDEEKTYCMSLSCWRRSHFATHHGGRRSIATYYHKTRGLNLCYECARRANVEALQRGWPTPCISLKEHFWQCLQS